LEDVRVLKPDLTIAGRWGLDMNDVDRAIASCKAAIQAKNFEQALSDARLAKSLLSARIQNNSELNSVQKALCDIQKELAETSGIAEYFSREPKWWTGGNHATMIPNPGFPELSKRYWQVGRNYRDCYARYLAGDKNGLWQKINAVRYDCLAMRVDVLACQREKLKPAQEQPIQDTKK
jgi:hypothetical protein